MQRGLFFKIHVLCISTTLFWWKVEEALFVFRAFETKRKKGKVSQSSGEICSEFPWQLSWQGFLWLSLPEVNTAWWKRPAYEVLKMMQDTLSNFSHWHAGSDVKRPFRVQQISHHPKSIEICTPRSITKLLSHHLNLGFPISSPPKVLSAAALLIFSRPSGKVSPFGWSSAHVVRCVNPPSGNPSTSINVVFVSPFLSDA